MLFDERVAEPILEIDPVVIPSPDLLDRDDLFIGKFLDDLLHDSKSQTHAEGDLGEPHLGIEIEADENVGVIAHEAPLRSFGEEALDAGQMIFVGLF